MCALPEDFVTVQESIHFIVLYGLKTSDKHRPMRSLPLHVSRQTVKIFFLDHSKNLVSIPWLLKFTR